MANSKISALTSATTPLAGTEVLPIVQSSTTKQVSIANVTAGRSVNMNKLGLASTGTPSYEIDGTVEGADATYKLSVYGSGIAPYVRMQRARGTIASPTIIGAGGFMGNVLFDGFDGTNMVSAARIHALQAGTATTGIVQGAIVTSTANSSGVLTEVTRADQNQDFKVTTGNIIQGTAAKGVNFTANTPAAGMTSQLLNWYEEGTWTPVIGGSTGTSGQTYDIQAGYYTRVGRLVTVHFRVALTAKGTITGNAQIQGLPFTINNSNGGQSSAAIGYFVLATNVVWVGGIGAIGGTAINLQKLAAAASNSSAMVVADIDPSSAFMGSFSYIV